MHIGQYLKIGALSSIISLSSCQKAPLVKLSKDSVPKSVSEKVDLMSYRTSKILRDTSYKFFGYDTLEITNKNAVDFMQDLNRQAEKNTPKVVVGKHIEVQMIPKRGGGFDQIHVWKNDYEPVYANSKAIIKSKDIYTRDSSDFYIPVEYYGIPNTKLNH